LIEPDPRLKVYTCQTHRKEATDITNKDPSPLSDSKLAQLFEEHVQYVFRTALLLTRSQTMADDVTQETFIRVMRKYHLYDESKSFRPWLYRLTVNVARNMLRKQKWLKWMGNHYTDEGGEMPEALVVSEKNDQLWSAILRLSQKCREVVILHYYQDLRLEEVAYALQIPVGTCKSRLNAALSKLRSMMNEQRNDIFEGDKVYE